MGLLLIDTLKNNKSVFNPQPGLDASKYGIWNLTKSSITYNNLDIQIEDFFFVKDIYQMRPDLIAAVKLGDQSKVGSLLKINGISNPFSLKEGRFILIPSQSTIDRSFDVKKISNQSSSSSNTNTDRQSFNNKYKNEQSLQIRTEERITLREKITNIRDMNSNAIWTELNYPSDTPTVFEITGSTPIVDPFGKVVAYNSTATRSENQQIE